MRVAAVIGPSNSGKTTLVEQLIRHFVERGQRVAAIKHTHHPVNERIAGDSGRFIAAGASPVVFAGDGEAIVFRGSQAQRVRYEDPDELLALIEADIVLIEGFRSVSRWPRIELDGSRHIALDEALTILDNSWR